MTRMGRGRAVVVLALPLALLGCAGPPSSPTGQAERLLDAVVLPHGARGLASAGGLPTAFQSDVLECAGLTERERYWRVPGMTVEEAQAWFGRHVPAGLRSGGSGSGGDRGGETMTEEDYLAGSGVATGSRVVVMAVTDGSGVAVRASAQVVPAGGCRGEGSHFAGVH